MLAVLLAVVAAVLTFVVVVGLGQEASAVQAAVAAIQAVGALVVMAATVTLTRLTGEYVRETRRLADVTALQESWRRQVQAADSLVGCLEELRWETSEKFGRPANLGPSDVRALCREWQSAWRLNRAFISDHALKRGGKEFEELTREARALIGASNQTATKYAEKLAIAAEPLIGAFDVFRSKPPDGGTPASKA